ncbi:hypothetical protein M885DRAFT_467689 [Pelagophyceae sp. CCMP2097]|nr:hypothetical protein M885DRAFT_467689 [Pelagophyceae sp. CCMP2097]
MPKHAQATVAAVDQKLVDQFEQLLESDEVALPVAAIEVLVGVIKRSRAATMHGLDDELRNARDDLLRFCTGNPKALHGRTSISLASGSELFLRHVTRTFLEFSDFDLCKEQLLARGENFASQSVSSRERIAALGHPFVRDSAVVLVHGRSRVVTALLQKAAAAGRDFSVLVPEGRPSCAGYVCATELAKAGIPVTIIADATVAHKMESVDCVIVGAEGVMENGGIINKIGTLGVACCAKAFHKPLYVAAESFKFARLFPLDQKDLPDTHSSSETLEAPGGAMPPGVGAQSPACDYTPPGYITLLFTDIGVLTPAAVSDELIRLYQ